MLCWIYLQDPDVEKKEGILTRGTGEEAMWKEGHEGELLPPQTRACVVVCTGNSG